MPGRTFRGRASLLGALLVALGTWSPAPAEAQTSAEVGMNFQLGFPQDAFARNVDNTGVGAGLFGGLRPRDLPLLFGVDLGFINYGRRTRTEPMPGIPEITLEVQTDNNILLGHSFLRLQQREEARIRPYADVLFGFKYLVTESRLRGLDSDRDEDFARTVNLDDWAMSYGAGAGVDITVTTRPARSEEAGTQIRFFKIHVGARYLGGSTAEYLREDSITRQEDDVEYDLRRSRTNLLQPVIGATLIF